MELLQILLRHYREVLSIFGVFLIYRILIFVKAIDWIKNFIDPRTTETIVDSPSDNSTFIKLKNYAFELYYCSVMVFMAEFIWFQLPKVSTVSDFNTIGQFLFTPPMKYLIIFQVSVGLVLGLFSLPHMTIEKIVTPFGHYGVNKKIEQVTSVIQEEVAAIEEEAQKAIVQLTNIYRIRLNMMQLVPYLGVFEKDTKISETGLGYLTTYIQGCYNEIFGDEAVSTYAIPFYDGSLDLNNEIEILSLKIIEAVRHKEIITSEDGVCPAEIAVPLRIDGNSYVILFLKSEIIPLSKEDGEAIQGLWRYVRAIDMGENRIANLAK